MTRWAEVFVQYGPFYQISICWWYLSNSFFYLVLKREYIACTHIEVICFMRMWPFHNYLLCIYTFSLDRRKNISNFYNQICNSLKVKKRLFVNVLCRLSQGFLFLNFILKSLVDTRKLLNWIRRVTIWSNSIYMYFKFVLLLNLWYYPNEDHSDSIAL